MNDGLRKGNVFFFLHNKLRDGGRGAQRPVLHDVILTPGGGGGWSAKMSTAKTCYTNTAAVVKWIVL